ncbi:MAG TPA: NB-ARC domain-containing protein, partial [Thermoleophilia bacterium]|nr:NB-ARC domain-containing protein [Thermoleophilia bacterium]
WRSAPSPLPDWVGRERLLAEITADWNDAGCRGTGLVGFGGEGKSSLARRWVDDLLADGSQPQPDGVFWWGFYENRNVDEFFESALTYLSGRRVDPRRYPSSNAKAHLIAAMLHAGRYLFVLDGLEVMQHQEGDEYGLLVSDDLAEFLGYFAAPEHSSFCLITSRATLPDLMDYTTHTHRDVMRLSPDDGRALLRNVGVEGDDDALDQVVADWDGHALTLSLLGGYLADRYGGNVAHIDDIPPPTADEPRYERVHRVLRRYDEHLTEPERAFLTLFSAFRTPVDEAALEAVFRTETDATALNAPIAALDEAAFREMIGRLGRYRILRHDPAGGQYTTHPLVRAHYLARLTAGDEAQTHAAHERIKDYYLAAAGDTPEYPTLDDLKPLIEVVHHACRAGAYDEAFRIFWVRVLQRNRRVIVDQLGAHQTNLALMLELFPDNDPSREPRISSDPDKSFIVNEVGLCLMVLGHPRKAVPFFERGTAMAVGMEHWGNASRSHQNLSDLHICLGELEAGAAAAGEALTLARRGDNKSDERDPLCSQAWVAHLRGELKAAGSAFQEAEALERKVDPTTRYLYSYRGIRHADHLRRTGDAARARRITEANLGICEKYHWADDPSLSHRVMGQLCADDGQDDSARQHFDEALRLARGTTAQHVLIEALLARGLWAGRNMGDAAAAFSDLNEALTCAVQGGYRIHEADIRIAMARAHVTAGEKAAARTEANRARQMSEEMGYHWGKLDAAEVLKEAQAG